MAGNCISKDVDGKDVKLGKEKMGEDSKSPTGVEDPKKQIADLNILLEERSKVIAALKKEISQLKNSPTFGNSGNNLMTNADMSASDRKMLLNKIKNSTKFGKAEVVGEPDIRKTGVRFVAVSESDQIIITSDGKDESSVFSLSEKKTLRKFDHSLKSRLVLLDIIHHVNHLNLNIYFCWSGPTTPQEIAVFNGDKKLPYGIGKTFKRDSPSLIKKKDSFLFFFTITNDLVVFDLDVYFSMVTNSKPYSPATFEIKPSLKAMCCPSSKRIVGVTISFVLVEINLEASPPTTKTYPFQDQSDTKPRVTSIVASTNENTQPNFTLVAAYNEIQTEVVFYLFDQIFEFKMVADLQNQLFEIGEMHEVYHGNYSLLLAASTCDNIHLLLVCDDVVAVLQSNFELMNGVIRGVAMTEDSQVIVFGRTREDKGFLKKIQIPQ